jgi:hypothetical protein
MTTPSGPLTDIAAMASAGMRTPNLECGAAGDERGGVGAAALVHHVDHRDALPARPGEEIRDALDGEGAVRKDNLPNRGEVLLLSVDDQEGGLLHRTGLAFRGVGNWRAHATMPAR